MKLFVRVISTLIIIVYGIETLFLAAGSIYGIVLAVHEILFGFGGTIDGSTTPILDGIGRFFLGICIIFLIALILIAVAEVAFMVLNYVKAIKKESFEYYWTLSLTSLIAGAVNIAFILILLIVLVNAITNEAMCKTFENIGLIMIGTNFFMGFWSILNLLSSKECVSNGW